MGQYHGHAGFLAFTKAMPVLHQSRLNGMRIFDPPYTGIVDRLLGWIVR
jgi:coniferyl-aldehyde dehydrogenase